MGYENMLVAIRPWMVFEPAYLYYYCLCKHWYL